MVLHKRDLNKVRMGLAKCPSCGEFYDPTTTGGPCPHCAKRYNLATIAFAVVVLLFLLLWVPLEGAAKAQADPEPTAHCWVEPDGSERCLAPAVTAQATATATPVLSPPFVPTPTPVVISPVAWCSVGPCVWLPVVVK